MDSDVINNPDYQTQMFPALKAIPAVSVVMNTEDLFGATRGIYANPKETGAEWERPASLELIYPNGDSGFHVGCGIRIQGGWNRRPEKARSIRFGSSSRRNMARVS